MLALLLVVGAWAGFRHLSDPSWIRRKAEAILCEMTGGDVRIASARFSLFEGLFLSGVQIRVRPDVSAGPRAHPHDPPLFAAHELHLIPDFERLWRGELRIAEIKATDPVFCLIADRRNGRCNWQALAPRPQQPDAETEPPIIRLRRAVVRLFSRDKEATRLVDYLHLNLVASPGTRRPHTYEIRWRMRDQQQSKGKAFVDFARSVVRTEDTVFPTVSLEAASMALDAGPTMHRWMGILGLRGEIQPVQITLDPRRRAHPEIAFAIKRGSLSVPLDRVEARMPPEERLVRLSGVHGQVRLAGDSVEVDLRGRMDLPASHWRPAEVSPPEVRVSGRLHGLSSRAADFSSLGYELKLSARRVRVPERGPEAPPAARRFVQRWWRTYCFYRFFDPHGLVDIEADVRKNPGAPSPTVLRELVLTARGASASFQFFPYRLTDLTGSVTFRPGGVYLEDLEGLHHGDRVHVDGWLSSPHWYAACELDIRGEHVRLASDLYEALSPRYQSFWRMFRPAGRADVRVRLAREEGSREHGAKPWMPEIEVDSHDASAYYAGFPYGLKPLSGRVTLTDDRFVLDQIRADHAGGAIVLDGQGFHGGPQAGIMNIAVHATDLPIDAKLRRALPPDGRRVLDSLHLAGRTDLDGRLYLDQHKNVLFDLTARVRNGAMQPDEVPCALENLDAVVRLTRDRIDIKRLTAAHRDCAISVVGSVRRGPGNERLDLSIRSERLALSRDLYEAMPSRLKAVWDMLNPQGTIGLCLDVRRDFNDPAQTYRARAVVEALGVSLRYADFPLPFQDVRGRAIVTGERVELIGVTARHEDAAMRLDGSIRTSQPAGGSVRVRAHGLSFSPALREALPWRLRRSWNHMQPKGRFDLALDELSFRTVRPGQTQWTCDGRLAMHDARFNLGLAAESVEGQLEGTVHVFGPGEDFSLDARLNLEHAVLASQPLAKVSAHLRRGSNDRFLRIEDVRADLHGGQCVADAEVHFERATTRYGLSAVVQNMDLGRFLQAGRPTGSLGDPIPGRVEGRLYLAGTAGRPGDRHGQGELHIAQARLGKLPILLSVLRLLHPGSSDDDLNAATLRFHLAGDRLTFDDLVLRGRGVSLVGRGTARTTDHELDLTLAVGDPRRLPRVPILTELLEGAAREFMVIRIEGPIHQPDIVAQPFQSVDEAIKVLFQPKEPRPAVRFNMRR